MYKDITKGHCQVGKLFVIKAYEEQYTGFITTQYSAICMVQCDKTGITIAAHTTAKSFLHTVIKVTRNITGVDNKSFPSSTQRFTCGVYGPYRSK